MAKNIKCSQCKYLRIAGVYSPTEGGNAFYDCRADLSIKIDKNYRDHLRVCPLFRCKIETAYEEVKRDLFQKIKELFKKILARII